MERAGLKQKQVENWMAKLTSLGGLPPPPNMVSTLQSPVKAVNNQQPVSSVAAPQQQLSPVATPRIEAPIPSGGGNPYSATSNPPVVQSYVTFNPVAVMKNNNATKYI